jgi:ferritin-like protein
MFEKDGFFRSPRSVVRIVRDGQHAPERRNFLRTMARQGVSISALCLVHSNGSMAAVDPAAAATPGPAALEPGRSRDGKVVRDFASPYLELTRLLREATEVEHALMLQYLYAAFSLKPTYADIAGNGAPGSSDLIGVAVQEMQHLAAVNRLLAALGAAPNLVRQEFPYEPAIYPFEFSLEPLSRKSLAKYIYAEAPSEIFRTAATPSDRAFATTIMKLLGPGVRVNHVGSLYDAVISRLEDVAATERGEGLDVAYWLAQLHHIKSEGEEQHFLFFRDVFEGTHPGFGKQREAWDLPSTHRAYPSLPLPVNPTAYVGHDDEIGDPTLLALSWLGDLHYWTMLFLLDLHFREPKREAFVDLARLQMLGPVLSLARHLPTLGGAMPFDVLNVGSAPGSDANHSCRFAVEMLHEAQLVATAVGDALPPDYPVELAAETLKTLEEAQRALQLSQR